jgi:hypothetical protein
MATCTTFPKYTQISCELGKTNFKWSKLTFPSLAKVTFANCTGVCEFGSIKNVLGEFHKFREFR